MAPNTDTNLEAPHTKAQIALMLTMGVALFVALTLLLGLLGPDSATDGLWF